VSTYPTANLLVPSLETHANGRYSVITTPNDVKEFYSDGLRHHKAESSNAGWLFRQVLGRCVGLINGEDWRRVRSHLELPLSYRTTVARLEEVLQEAKHYIQNDFMQYVDKSRTSSSAAEPLVVNPVHALQWFPFFHMAQIFYGALSPDDRAELQRIGELRGTVFRHVVQGGVVNRSGVLSRLLQTTASKKADQFLAAWQNYNAKMYEKQLRLNPDAPIVSLWRMTEENRVSSTEVR
jgi:gliotoxin/aspirochlorine/mycotoxins biosynthesis cytochrome P450 monooxygenase